ncbi:MAG: hypothetical protein M1275_03685 [Patescibacteria group bacterium]|nr:hypothetical protein [Patescibacteria group bacterium]
MKKPVAIFTFLYRPSLSPEQEISIRHLNHYLGKYDKFACAPKGSGYGLPSFKTVEFDPKYFRSVKDNARLLSSRELFAAFADYEYMLQYELDALALSSDLGPWLNSGYDYIGAPWIKANMIKPYPYPVDSVGCSGFSLKRVSAFLKIIDGREHPWKVMARELKKGAGPKQLWDIWSNARGRAKLIEDRFWSWKGRLYYPGFKIAPVSEALKFAFEIAPEKCLKLNNGRLPFGAHAWFRYNREFWEPYILKSDVIASPAEAGRSNPAGK